MTWLLRSLVLRPFIMSPWSLALLLATCMASATADVFYDVDWVTAENANKSIPITGPAESNHSISKRQTGYKSRFGFFQHWSSGKYIHLQGNPICPEDYTNLIIYHGYHLTGSMDFRFVQVIGHYGYLEHKCGKVVHPKRGALRPADDTILDMHGDRHAAALFTIDQDNIEIVHRSGKRFHPFLGKPNPKDNVEVVLHHGRSDASRFQFVFPGFGVKLPVFPNPTLAGYWKIIYSVVNPLAHHEYHISYKVGKSISKQASREYEWKIGAGVSFAWFQASTELRLAAQNSETATWETSITRDMTIKVSPGQTVVTWQYFFEAEQFGDGFQFRSTLLADTDDPHKQPELLKLMAQK